jgi:hypothetical protein
MEGTQMSTTHVGAQRDYRLRWGYGRVAGAREPALTHPMGSEPPLEGDPQGFWRHVTGMVTLRYHEHPGTSGPNPVPL